MFYFLNKTQIATSKQAEKLNIYLTLSQLVLFLFNLVLNAAGFGFDNSWSAGFSYVEVGMIFFSVLSFIIGVTINNYYKIYKFSPLLIFYLSYLLFTAINIVIQIIFFPVNDSGSRPVNPYVLFPIFILDFVFFCFYTTNFHTKCVKYLKEINNYKTIIDYDLSHFEELALKKDNFKGAGIDAFSYLNRTPFFIIFLVFSLSWNNDWVEAKNIVFFVAIGIYIAIFISYFVVNSNYRLFKFKFLFTYAISSLIMELSWLIFFYITNNLNFLDLQRMKYGLWLIEISFYFIYYGTIFSIGSSALEKAKLIIDSSSDNK